MFRTRSKYIFLLSFLLNAYLLFGSDPDSLKRKLNTANDTLKVRILTEICQKYLYANGDSSLKYARQGIMLAEKTGKVSHLANFINTIANIYLERSDYSNALNNYIEAEKYFKSINDRKSVLMVNGNIGIVYELQNLPQKALMQYESVLESARAIDYNEVVANTLNHIGSVYYTLGQKDKALAHFKEALSINEDIKNHTRIMECLNNIAIIYQELGQFDEALHNFNQYLNYSKKNNDKHSRIIAYHNIALVYKDQKNLIKTIQYLDSSIVLANQIKDFEDLIEIYATYTEIFTQQNNYEKAFETFQLKAAAQDSLLKQTRDKQFIEMSTKYEADKKEAENQILKATSEKQKTINLAVSIGLVLVAALAFFIYRGYNEKKKANNLLASQNIEIKEQKGIIEEKQKEILDSISYAKRLQDAILPPLNLIQKHLPDSFIYYKPKDIVAGDFYWMEHKNDLTFIAAADCTGHGVPGAMVSVVCSNALNRAVLEFSLSDPGQILTKTRELVLETFAKSDADVKDGMDISLCAFNRPLNTIIWSGANNPLWYTHNNQIHEVTANKQPIGKNDNPKPFTSHTIQLQKGDSVFLFTDGYADQFGGPKGKKFKYKQFQELLLSVSQLQPSEQLQKINTAFVAWKNNHEQVDDVCVIGIKI